MHDLIDRLTKELNLTPEQQFWVTAQIKREIHLEKASLCQRFARYGEGPPIFIGEGENRAVVGHEPPEDPWLVEQLQIKADSHKKWAAKPDEEMVTWSIGSHKYIQKVPPCKDCQVELTGKTHYHYWSQEQSELSGYYCPVCYEKRGLGADFDFDSKEEKPMVP